MRLICLLCWLLSLAPAGAQTTAPDSAQTSFALEDCIVYALTNQPGIRSVLLSEQVTEKDIWVALSAWLPQIQASGNFQYYFERPVSIFPDFMNPESGELNEVQIGTINNSTLTAEVDQVLFNQDVLLALRSAKYDRRQAEQTTRQNQIDVIVNVTQAFFQVLLTQQQLQTRQQDIVRLQRSLDDAYQQFQSGITDNTDYKRAEISLNSALADRKSATETLQGDRASLKQLMGYPPDQALALRYQTDRLEQDIVMDTTLTPDYRQRVEYDLLQTQRSLQDLNVSYYRWGFLPQLSASATYNLAYQNNTFSELYQRSFPNSSATLRLSLPLFQGTQRMQNLQRAQLLYQQNSLDLEAFQYQANTEYEQALATYKSSWYNYRILTKNQQLAQEVYETVSLQYNAGIKTYLEVVVAETDLRNAQRQAINALFQTMSAKINLQKALGQITTIP